MIPNERRVAEDCGDCRWLYVVTTRAADEMYLAAARTLAKAAHPEETPLAVGLLAGDGSILQPYSFCGCADR